MTLTQIQFFLETASCRNISTAAEHLYTTQPGLSRQLTSMEQELNMQLLIRNNKGIRLTPAGQVLQEEFQKLMELYVESVHKAQIASRGYSDTISIGILEGLKIDAFLPRILDFFNTSYPQAHISIRRLTFGKLILELRERQLDAAISLDVNFIGKKDLKLYDLMPYRAMYFVPAQHPLAEREQLVAADFRNVPLAIVETSDAAEGVEKVRQFFHRHGGFWPTFHFSSTMKDTLLWVESGSKCALLNDCVEVTDSALVKAYPTEIPEKNYLQLACLEENTNQMLRVLTAFLFS
ncbi:MAG: LysR family transcriptional regulator [Lachnospiraceae bacterium]|nr:LysR family transcriptional regulator [Lachnospiraceae bacterium]